MNMNWALEGVWDIHVKVLPQMKKDRVKKVLVCCKLPSSFDMSTVVLAASAYVHLVQLDHATMFHYSCMHKIILSAKVCKSNLKKHAQIS